MNKIITSSIMLVAGAMMVACTVNAQSITIEKRHYKSGYYIDFGKRKSETKQTSVVKQNIVAVERNTNNTIAPINSGAEGQMQMVPVTGLQVKKEKTHKRVAAFAYNAVVQSSNVTSTKTKSTHNETIKAVADDSVTSVSSTDSSSNNAGIPLVLLVIITILIPFLGVGLAKGIGTQFWIALILTLLFFLPGLIYGLIVVLGND